MSSEPITIYGNMNSQPSRTVVIFCQLHDIPHEFITLDFKKGEHKAPDFLKINPNGTVPAMTHGDFKLYESFAIIEYLAKVFNINSQWWPTDPQQSGLVHCYLHWHHEHTRVGGRLPFYAVIMPKVIKVEPPPHALENARSVLESCLRFIEAIFASGKYVARTDVATIADIACFSQLRSLVLMNYDLSAYPHVMSWEQEMLQVPHVQASLQVMEEFSKVLATL